MTICYRGHDISFLPAPYKGWTRAGERRVQDNLHAHAQNETIKNYQVPTHSRPQRPRSFWSAPRIVTSGRVQQRKSAIHGLPVTLRMLRVKCDKSDWFWSQSIVFTNPFKTGMSLDLARGRDSWCWPKGARPLRTRMVPTTLLASMCHAMPFSARAPKENIFFEVDIVVKT